MNLILMDFSTYLLFVATAVAIIVVPGPTVTLIVANSLRAGPSAGLLNVAGTQLGILSMMLLLAAGLAPLVSSVGALFDLLRLAGAAYLIWLGIKLWRADGSLADAPAGADMRPAGGYFWQGFWVIWANPKALLVFGAFIPQFIDPAGHALAQVLLLGGTFMAVGTLFDSLYALAAGKTGALLSRANIRLIERLSGSCLIGGGLWLAFERR